MGTRPREIEAASLLRLEKILGPHFEMRRLHELTADRAIRPLGGTHQAEALGNNAQIGHYLPLQVKACESDVATWLRFLKFKLRKAQQSLCGVVVLGIHRDRSSLLIVHTHAHDHWTLQNLADEKFWFCRKKAIPRLLELWRQLAAPLATIQHRFVTSAAQLVEARMRQAFRETLEKLSMKLQEPPAEFSEIDGYIECETSGGTRRFSVQERTCKWRRVRGKFAGQFASLRRSSGKHFSTGIDFLALHVRADPQEQFGYSGTYLIPAAELARRGYLAEASDKYLFRRSTCRAHGARAHFMSSEGCSWWERLA